MEVDSFGLVVKAQGGSEGDEFGDIGRGGLVCFRPVSLSIAVNSVVRSEYIEVKCCRNDG